MAAKTIWHARVDEIFGGYSLLALGTTEANARESLWKLYCQESASRNANGMQFCETKEGFEVYHNVQCTERTIGVGY